MARPRSLVVLAVVVGGAALAYFHWPRLEVVETGRTPEYPDIQPREYAASEEAVARAARAAIAQLSGWTVTGGGKGPGGSEIQARATLPVIGFTHDIDVRIRREGARTRV